MSPDALEFIFKLVSKHSKQLEKLLKRRVERRDQIDKGQLPQFLEAPEIKENKSINQWIVSPLPKDLQDRRVEITGPVDRKMIINGLNSGANVFMADFEDSNSPTWQNIIQGQINLRDAVRGSITFVNPAGKSYQLKEKTDLGTRRATLMVRPRGLHLIEKHILVDNIPIPGAFLDFGLYFFHNAKQLIKNGTGPYFYLPKLENHLEARLWNDLFVFSQNELGIVQGTIKATVLLEHILASFEMDEILYELREHSAGLNCGRWDYIFSFIKVFRNHPDFVLPDRALVTMDTHFLNSYVKLLIQTCHRRKVHAMGGMAAQIPIKNDIEANNLALKKVAIDKKREVLAGHDGTWVAHPGLIKTALDIFNEGMPEPNQLDSIPDKKRITVDDLLKVPDGEITEAGLRINISVGIRYLEAWLQGNGCVPINNLMEDAATAEICRTQVWQWIKHNRLIKISPNTDKLITKEMVKELMEEELGKIKKDIGEENYTKGKFDLASRIFFDLVSKSEFVEFLTLVAYDHL